MNKIVVIITVFAIMVGCACSTNTTNATKQTQTDTDSMETHWYKQCFTYLTHDTKLTVYASDDSFSKLRLVVSNSSDDTVRREIVPHNEMLLQSFVVDTNGLNEHLQTCCSGEKQIGELKIQNDNGNLSFFYDVPICRTKYYLRRGKTFQCDTTDLICKYLGDNALPLSIERVFWEAIMEFDDAKNGMCNISYTIDLPRQSSPEGFHNVYVCKTVGNDRKEIEMLGVDDFFDRQALEDHNCCIEPQIRLRSTLINDKLKNILENNKRPPIVCELGRQNQFTIRYFIQYAQPKYLPDCQYRHRKAFYIDLVYDSVTKSFTRHAVPYDSIVHKQAELPIPEYNTIMTNK